jgi:HK97 family phage prohead protease
MVDVIRATVVDDDLWESKGGDVRDCQVEIRIQSPFSIEKGVKEHDDDNQYEMDDGDVMIRGPVYVGNEEMLDRHGELVDIGAIFNAWDGYKANPVILYNHSKTHGVIGRMTDVEMGSWEGIEGEVPIGRAIIDSGEEAIVRKIRKGLLRAFSIGFIARAAVKECKDEDMCYIKFTEIEWLETSVVDVPASPNALFGVEKHILGYEDMGDRIAILFDKMESEASKSEDSCGCSSSEKQIEPDEENEEISPVGTFDEDVVGRLELVEAFIDALESKSETTDSVITPLRQPTSQTEGESNMTEQEILEASEEEVVVKTDELEEEAPSEEEEALPEEVVEEVAEATEEESFEEVVEKEVDEPSTNDILIEVVKTLSGLEGRLTSIEEKMTTPDLSEEVAELKSIIEAKEAEIAELKTVVEAAEKEAEIEAEVSKRVAERVAGIPTAKAEASPKSLSPSVESKPKTGTTRFDPTPEVSKGMNGLASWLEHQLSTKRGA